MQLASFYSQENKITRVRDLSEQEVGLNSAYSKVCSNARNRLAPLRFAAQNYRTWEGFIQERLHKKGDESLDGKDECDRLLLNYLTTVYAMMEHFKKDLKSRFRKTEPEKVRQHDELLGKIIQTSWNFGFILDLRNYAQHIHLPVSRYSESHTLTTAKLEILGDSAEYLRNKKDWPWSNLTAEKGEIDLVKAMKDFHFQLLQSYGGFVAKSLFPDLIHAHRFYGNLADEVRTAGAQGKMIFLTEKADEIMMGTPQSFSFHTLYVPSNLFNELGISVPESIIEKWLAE